MTKKAKITWISALAFIVACFGGIAAHAAEAASAESATSSYNLTRAYLSWKSESDKTDLQIWGEVDGTENINTFVVNFYDDNKEKVASTTLKNPVGPTVSWHLRVTGAYDNDWWSYEWTGGKPTPEKAPKTAEFVINGEICGTIDVEYQHEVYLHEMNWADYFVAKVGDDYYFTLKSAIDTGAKEITLLSNVSERGAEVESGSGEYFIQILDKDITLDLNGKTVNGSFYLNSGSTAKFMNGTILNLAGNKSSGIESVGGNIVLTDMVMTNSARHAVRVKGGTAVIEGGTYAATGNSTYHVVNVSHASNVTIAGGVFSGNKGNSTAGGNALMIQDAESTVAITGGTFKNAAGIEGCICAAAGLTISGGTFDTWTYDKYLSKEKRYVAVQNADGMYDVGEATNWIQVADTTWYNAGTTEFTLDTPEKLAGVAKLVNEGKTFAGKTIKLAGNMDLAGLVWPGIGVYKDDTKSFQGTFDGAGFKVSNMDFSDDSSGVAASEANNYRGFFNYINNATITDLTVAGKVWTTRPASTEYGGALIVGHAKNSTIQNCVAEGTVDGTHNVAGVVVRVQDCTIKNCMNKADLTGSYSKMGGIAALVQNSETSVLFDGCVNEGYITCTARGEDGVGGIVGWVGYPNTANITIKNCENKGEITATGAATVGQIAAESWNGNHVFTGNKGLTIILATGHSAMDGLNFATVADGVATYVKNAELVAGNSYLVTAEGAKPVITLAAGQSITFDLSILVEVEKFDESGITAVAGVVPEEDGMKVTYTAAIAKVGETPYATIDEALAAAQEGEEKTVVVYGDAVWAEDFALAEGVTVQLADGLDETSVSAPKGYVWESGTLIKATNWIQVADTKWAETEPYIIRTAEELAGFAKLVNEGTTFAGKTVTLGNDIDLAGLVWPGIGVYKDDTKSFQGTFDGAGYKVSNMDLSDDSNGVAASEANNYRAFFNQIDNATVKDLTVAGNVWATAPASTEYGGALIAGCANNSTIEKCVAEGSVNGTHNVAGIVVRVKDSTIVNCVNKADLTGSYSKMGGIAALSQGSTKAVIDGCVNEGDITCTARGEDGVGGIIGWIGYIDGQTVDLVTVKNCENQGEITATGAATVGQIAGESWNGNNVFTGNKGLPTMLATGHSAMDGLNYATVEDGVATYVKTLKAGNTYLVTAPNPKPVIALKGGESITFDLSLADIDASGITAATTLEEPTIDGSLVTYTAKGYVVTVTWPDETTTDEVAYGNTFTLPARTIEGVSFIGWSGDVVSAVETLSVTVEESFAVTANYIPSELHTQVTNQVVVAYKDANELISIKDIQDLSLQNPTIEVGKDENGQQFADVGIKLMKATTLKDETNGGKPNWTPVVKGEPVDAFWADDNATMIIRLPADKKAQFFRFVPKNGLLK